MADSKRFLLRLDPRLFEALRRWADDDLRSINAQIEYLLTDQARRAGRLPRQSARPHLPDSTELEDVGRPANRRGSPASAGAARRKGAQR
jgi:hypothetical protein